LTGGAGAEIAAQVQHEVFSYLDAPIERVGAKDSPIPFAPALENYILPNDKDVVEAARRTLYREEQP
jgi:pyruvate dehydrogenase E1 component beta subunit